MDRESTKDFGDLIASYAASTPTAVESLAQAYNAQVEQSDANSLARLKEVWGEVQKLPVDPAVRDRMLELAQQIEADTRKGNHEVIGTLVKIGALTVGAVVVIAAAAAGRKHARPPTFWESLLGKK